MIEGFIVGDVKHEDDDVTHAVVATADRVVFLLSSCIPDIETHAIWFVGDKLGGEVDTDGRVEGFIEFSLGIFQHEAGLSDVSIPDETVVYTLIHLLSMII